MRHAVSRVPTKVWWLAALVVLLGSVFLGGDLVARATHTFPDVPTGAYYHADVDWMSTNGITLGCGGGNYCPDDTVTRGQMAAFLHRMAGVEQIHFFPCASTAFVPVDSTITYTNGGGWLQGNGNFACNIVLPQGAEVKALRVSVTDSSATEEISNCELYRNNLITSMGTYVIMANTGGTGVGATPGDIQISDTSIVSPFIDNQLYSYDIWCFIAGGSLNTGVYGARVEYKMTGVPAP